MSLADPIALLGLGALALAAPALGSRRFGPLVVRVAGLVAIAVLWLAARDRPVPRQVERPPHVVAVTTGPAPSVERAATGAEPAAEPSGDPAVDVAGWVARLRSRVGRVPGARLDILGATGSPGAPSGGSSDLWPDGAALVSRLAAGAVRARLDPHSLILVWNHPFDARAVRGPVTRALASYTTRPPPPVEPDAFELRALGAFEVGRPGAFELRFDRAASEQIDGLDGAVVLRLSRDESTAPASAPQTDPATDPVRASELEHTLALGELAQRGRVEVAWTPPAAGERRVELSVAVGGFAIAASGRVTVAEPSAVLVVGRDAQRVAAALRVQGAAVETAAELPAELPERGVVVALDALSAGDQERLLGFVDAGGGLFVVGGEDGGALCEPAEPLGAALPFRKLPHTAPHRDGIGTRPGGAEPTDDPERDDPPRPPDDPQPPSRQQQPPQPPDGPITGDTSAAKQVTPEERDVERRQVAMVLVIDRSWSMRGQTRSGATKMALAKTSAYETAQRLAGGDKLGIVAFSSTDEVVLELSPVPVRGLRERVGALSPVQDDTALYVGLRRAERMLDGCDAPIRHIVAVTDGDLITEDRAYSRSVALRMEQRGITVSVIHIVPERPSGEVREVAQIAKLGGGRYARTVDGSEIPALVSTEVQRVLGAAGQATGGGAAGAGPGRGDPDAARTGQQDPRGTDPPPEQRPPARPPPEPEPEPADPRPESRTAAELPVFALGQSVLLEPRPRPDEGFPPLRGISPVAGRPHARVLLATADGTPLLGFAHHGLGRVAAWSAGFTGPWSEPWRDDPAFPGRLAAWVRFLQPPTSEPTDADLIAERTLEPAAPVRVERAALARLALGPLQPVDGYQPPPVRIEEITQGGATDDALLALVALCLLAVVEFVALRTRRRERAA